MSASFGLAEFIVGRVIAGIGNGMASPAAGVPCCSRIVIDGYARAQNTATIPSLQSELAPPRIRGALVLISGALVATGIAVSYAVE